MEKNTVLAKDRYIEAQNELRDYKSKLKKVTESLEELDRREDPMGTFLVCSDNNMTDLWPKIKRFFDTYTYEDYHRVYNFMGGIVNSEKYKVAHNKCLIKVVTDRYADDSILYHKWHPYYDLNDRNLDESEIRHGYGMCELSTSELKSAFSKVSNIREKPKYLEEVTCFKKIMIRDFTTNFPKFLPYLNFTACVQNRNHIYIGLGGYNCDGPSLFFGYARPEFLDNEIVFSNDIEVLYRFCDRIYEMKKNTYCHLDIGEKYLSPSTWTFYKYEEETSEFVPCSRSDVIKRRLDQILKPEEDIANIKCKIANIDNYLYKIFENINEINRYNNIFDGIEEEVEDKTPEESKELPPQKEHHHKVFLK